MKTFIVNYLYIASGIIMHCIAMKKNYGSIGRILWCSVGFYFGPIVVPFIFLFKEKHHG